MRCFGDGAGDATSLSTRSETLVCNYDGDNASNCVRIEAFILSPLASDTLVRAMLLCLEAHT